MKDEIICGRCEGRPEQTDIGCCYHCGNTGKISSAEARHDRIEHLAMQLGYLAVRRQKRFRDEGAKTDECEPWSFLAAENGLHEHEYTELMAMAEGDQIMKGFEVLEEKIGQFLMDDLVEVMQRGLKVPEVRTPAKELPEVELDYDGEPIYGDVPTKEPNEHWPKKVPPIDVSKLPPLKRTDDDKGIPF